ncbi:hypothetical protein GSY69_07315 [Brevibacterium sp. 5221]|uniref:Bacterial Ig domain-containing protein n=1 Tax=Brevibacterium rongguiense TaxID=2695267 RepID=A0A6N9H884_9MICO|nr:hypothetical protein [Brevibacterium rongguiense]MYM19782.1 hypothetical protein [Brevibacterium rongguiense]
MKKLFLLPVSAGAALALALTGVQPVQASVGAAPQAQPAAIARAAAVGSHSTAAQAPAAAHAQAAKRSARPKLTVVSKHITVSSATKRGVTIRASHVKPGTRVRFGTETHWDGFTTLSNATKANRRGVATAKLRPFNGWLDAKRFDPGLHRVLYSFGKTQDWHETSVRFTVRPDVAVARTRIADGTFRKRGERLVVSGGQPGGKVFITVKKGHHTLKRTVRVDKRGKAVWTVKRTGGLKHAGTGVYRVSAKVQVEIGARTMSAAGSFRVVR